MSVTVDEVQRRERDGLLGEYLIPVGILQIPPYVAISAIVDLTTTPSNLRAMYPLAIEPFPGNETTKGFVQHCPSLNYKFLWLRPEDDDYKAKYEAFLERHHGINTMPSGYDVDHLFNRARAINLGLSYVRMVLLGPGENRSHGAGYEKSRTAGHIGTPGNQRGIDEIMLLKLCGIRSPRKNRPLSPETLTHIRRIASLFSIPPLEIERNIRELMEVAAFRPHDGD